MAPGKSEQISFVLGPALHGRSLSMRRLTERISRLTHRPRNETHHFLTLTPASPPVRGFLELISAEPGLSSCMAGSTSADASLFPPTTMAPRSSEAASPTTLTRRCPLIQRLNPRILTWRTKVDQRFVLSSPRSSTHSCSYPRDDVDFPNVTVYTHTQCAAKQDPVSSCASGRFAVCRLARLASGRRSCAATRS